MNLLWCVLILVWIALAAVFVFGIELICRSAVSWGVWEPGETGRAGRSAPAASPGARGATRPTIINDLARAGALECPRPKLETLNPEP